MKTKKRTRLAPYLIKQREKIFFTIWQNYKTDLAMTELADILNMPLDRFYKILKKQAINEKTKI